jgi:hypothetical protein
VVAAASLTLTLWRPGAGDQRRGPTFAPAPLHRLQRQQVDYSVGSGNGCSLGKRTHNIYGGTYFNPNFGVWKLASSISADQPGRRHHKDQRHRLSLVERLPVSQVFNLLGKWAPYAHFRRIERGSGIADGRKAGLSYGIGAEPSSRRPCPVWCHDEHSRVC